MNYVYYRGKVFSLKEDEIGVNPSDQLLYLLTKEPFESVAELRPCARKDCEHCDNYYGVDWHVCDCIFDPTVPNHPNFCFMFKEMER